MSSDDILCDIDVKAYTTTTVEFTATISRTKSATRNYLVAGLEVQNALFVHAETGNLALDFKMRTPLDYEVQLNCRARFCGDDGTTVGSITMAMNFNKSQTEQPNLDVITKEALQGVVKLKVELVLTCSVDLTPVGVVEEVELIRVISNASSTPVLVQREHLERSFPGFFKVIQPKSDVYMWPQDAPDGSFDQLMHYLKRGVLPDVPLASFNDTFDSLASLEATLLLQHITKQAINYITSQISVLPLLSALYYSHPAARKYLKPIVVKMAAQQLDEVMGALSQHIIKDEQEIGREALRKHWTMGSM